MWVRVLALPPKSDRSGSTLILIETRTMADEHFVNARPVKPSVPFSCLPHILEHHAKRSPDAPAILASGRAPLTYSRLYRHIDEMGRTLRAMGIARRDRVAVVLPNGPEMAVTILTVAASATCAPMNPAYGAEELDRYFADLRPRALITSAGMDSPASRVARARGIRSRWWSGRTRKATPSAAASPAAASSRAT